MFAAAAAAADRARQPEAEPQQAVDPRQAEGAALLDGMRRSLTPWHSVKGAVMSIDPPAPGLEELGPSGQ